MKLLLIGCGNMSGSLLQAWLPLASKHWTEIWIVRCSIPQKRKIESGPWLEALRDRIFFVDQASDLPAGFSPDQILLGVKPQVVGQVMEEYLSLGQDSLWLSIAAGLPLSWYRDRFGPLRILRIMPNLGALAGRSATLVYAPENLWRNSAEQELAETLLSAFGVSFWCGTEEQLDRATPVLSSGVAYFYLLTELLEKSARDLGIPSAEARRLSEEVLIGAASFLEAEKNGEGEGGRGAAEFRAAVTSKGGVTEAALQPLLRDLPALLEEGITRGVERIRTLQQ